jgi:hypothetical protein
MSEINHTNCIEGFAINIPVFKFKIHQIGEQSAFNWASIDKKYIRQNAVLNKEKFEERSLLRCGAM